MSLQTEETYDTVETTDQQNADTQIVTEASDPVFDNQEGTPAVGNDEGVPDRQDDAEVVPLERYKNAQARMTQATQEAADLRREVAALQAQISAIQQGQSYQNQPQDQPDETSKLSQLRSEYPELAGPIVDVLERQQKVLADLRAQSESVAASTNEVRKTTFVQAVKSAHPDMDAIVASDDFRGWIYRQPQFVQQAVTSDDPASAIKVLDMYKKEVLGMTGTTNKRALLDAAKQVASPAVGRNTKPPATEPTPKFTREQIAAMSLEEFEKHSEEIDAAMAAGLIS